MNKIGTIYIATNQINGKQYVGQTTRTLQRRIYEHTVVKKNLPFWNAIQKYDIENFKWISFSCPEEDMDLQEGLLIKELNTLIPNGYNLNSGGSTNKHLSDITKQKIKENHADMSGKNNPNFGNHKLAGENNPRARQVLLISPNNKEYNLPCYKPFCKAYGLNISCINAVLQGKQKQHKGWTGRYLDAY